MTEIKLNQKECYVDKRKLLLDFEFDGARWIFYYDAWGWDKVEQYLTRNGKTMPFEIISDYKHNIQAYFIIPEADDDTLFIDRRYCHNHSCDVYFRGKVYVAGSED